MTGQGTGVQLLQYYLNLTSSNLSTSGRLRFRSGPCCVHPRHCLSFYFSAVSFRSLPQQPLPWAVRPLRFGLRSRSLVIGRAGLGLFFSSTASPLTVFCPLLLLSLSLSLSTHFPSSIEHLSTVSAFRVVPGSYHHHRSNQSHLSRLARVALEPLPGPSQTTYTNNGCTPDNECLWLVTTSLNLTSPSFTFERNILPLHHEIDHHEGVS
jgi:hypothetical protein